MKLLVSWINFLDDWKLIYISGLLQTFKISFLSVSIGFLFGVFIAIVRELGNKKINRIIHWYINIVRDTPLMIQVMIFVYGFSNIIPSEYNWVNNVTTLSIIAMCINTSAYIAEILRGGLKAVSQGQIQAAKALGLTKYQALRHIIFPQAIRISIPALGNEFISLIKASSIVSFVGVSDLMFSARIISGSTGYYFMPYITTALIYFTITFTLSRLLMKIEL